MTLVTLNKTLVKRTNEKMWTSTEWLVRKCGHTTHTCPCINPQTYACVYSSLENIEIIEPNISRIPDWWRQYKSFPQTVQQFSWVLVIPPDQKTEDASLMSPFCSWKTLHLIFKDKAGIEKIAAVRKNCELIHHTNIRNVYSRIIGKK